MGCFHGMVSISVFGWKWWTNTHFRLGNIHENQLNLFHTVSDLPVILSHWSAFDLISEDVVPSEQKPSWCHVHLPLFCDILIALTIWLIINHLTSVIVWWTRPLFSSAKDHPGLDTSSRLYISLLNLPVHFCTVDKTGFASLI